MPTLKGRRPLVVMSGKNDINEQCPPSRLPAGLGMMPTAKVLAGSPVATDLSAPLLGTCENPSNSGKEYGPGLHHV